MNHEQILTDAWAHLPPWLQEGATKAATALPGKIFDLLLQRLKGKTGEQTAREAEAKPTEIKLDKLKLELKELILEDEDFRTQLTQLLADAPAPPAGHTQTATGDKNAQVIGDKNEIKIS
jgi:hypothetical protein